MKPAKEQIEVNLEELIALVERARQGPLTKEDCQRLEDAIQALSVLIERIGEKNTTISQLRALLSKPSTEKTSKVLEQAGIKVPPQNPPPPQGEGSTEAGARAKWRPGVSGRRANQNRARFFEAWRSLPRLFEGKGVPADRARTSHPSDGPGADCRPSLRVRTSALQSVRRGLRGGSAARDGREKVR